MVGKIWTNTGITVHRQIVVRSKKISHGRTKSGTASVTSVVKAVSDVRPMSLESDQEATAGEMRDDLGRHSAREEGVAGLPNERQQSHETVQHLIEFLTKIPPPKGNRMSTPDSFSTSPVSAGGNKWKRRFDKLRSKGRKLKKRHSGPPTITLPDTAVAATTIEGHRHISISIPLEHSYMEPNKLAHYDTTDLTQELQSRLGRKLNEPARKYSTEKPGVSVLRTVAEDRESIVSEPLTATPRSSENPERSTSLRVPPTRVRSGSITSMTDEGLPSSLRGTTRVGTPPGEEEGEEEDVEEEEETIRFEFPRPPTRGIEAQTSRKAGPQPVVVLPTLKPSSVEPRATQVGTESPVESTRGEPSSTPHMWNTSTVPAITFTLPARKSSKRIAAPASLPLEGAYSIDNMLSPSPIPSPHTSDESSGSGLGSTSSNSQDQTFNFGLGRFARGSVAESVMTTGSEPRVMNAQAARAYRTQVPIVVRPPSVHSVEVALHGADEFTGSEDTNGEDTNGEDPPPTFGDANESQEEHHHHHHRHEQPHRPQLTRSLTTNAISRAAQTDISAHASIQRILDRQQYLQRRKTDASRPPFSRKDRTITPPGIHHLPSGTVSVWPEYGRVGDMPSPPQSEKPPSTVRHVGAISQAVPLSPISPSPNTRRRLLFERPSAHSTLSGGVGGLQTPSLDHDESAASTTSSSTSLSDDSNLTPGAAALDPSSYYRRLERRAERDAHKARRARHSFETLARDTRGAARLRETSDHMSWREEQARRNDKLNEHRLRDMERRLRRLERNGDVWLRTMVPLFESLSRLLEEKHRYSAATTTAVDESPSSSLPSLVPFPDAAGPSSSKRYTGRRSSSLRGHKRASDQSLNSRSKSLHYPRHRHSHLQHLDDSHSHKKRQSAPSPGELDRDRTGTVRPWWKAEVPAEYPGTNTGVGAGSGSDYFSFRDRLKRSLGGSRRFHGKEDSRAGDLGDGRGSPTSFEKLEPLMRELQGAARFTIGGGVGRGKGEYHVPGMWEESLPEMTSTDESESGTVRRGKKQTTGGKEREKDHNKGGEVSALH